MVQLRRERQIEAADRQGLFPRPPPNGFVRDPAIRDPHLHVRFIRPEALQRALVNHIQGAELEDRIPLSHRLQPVKVRQSIQADLRQADLRIQPQRRLQRRRAERLTRYVNGLLEKKPTVSIPSAREVLRTRVGDCNEHTALFVAMARAAGIPARIAVGLAFVRGAFYYHAWPEVYIDEGSRGLWLPVDPTFNQFPADATHVRLARGGLDKQTVVLPLMGKLTMDVLDVELAPNATPILVGKAPLDLGALAIPIPRRESSCCACPK
jgi:transglutaminase-like putative cysteine protease